MVGRDNFEGETILLAGAGCATGKALARGYAGAGGRLVLIDADDREVIQIARSDPGRIDPLRLDLLDERQRSRFLQVWEDEPVHVLVHLLALRHPDRLGEVIPALIALTEALGPALHRAQGRVLIIIESTTAASAAVDAAFDPALRGLVALLDRHAQDGMRGVVAIELAGGSLPPTDAEIVDTALWLTSGDAPGVRGSVLRLAGRAQA